MDSYNYTISMTNTIYSRRFFTSKMIKALYTIGAEGNLGLGNNGPILED